MLRISGSRALFLSVLSAVYLGSLSPLQLASPSAAQERGPSGRLRRPVPHSLPRLPENPPEPVKRVYTPEEEARRAQVITKVEGVELTVGKLEDAVAQQSPLLRGRYQSADELKKLLDSMVRFELLAGEAGRRGYPTNKTVVRTVKDGAIQNLMRAEIEDKVTPQSITADEIKAYYDGNPAEFHRASERRASQILVETEAEAKPLLVEAQKLDAQGFAELAKKQSKDIENKLRGGDLGFFAKEQTKERGDDKVEKVADAVRKAAFELKEVGDTFPKPIAVDTGFVILRLTGERPERHTSVAEAEQAVRTKLWREKRQKAMTDLIEQLKKRDKPQVFTDRVDLVKLDDMERQPSGFSPSRR